MKYTIEITIETKKPINHEIDKVLEKAMMCIYGVLSSKGSNPEVTASLKHIDETPQ